MLWATHFNLVLMFFGGNIVSAVIATVIYSVPPIIRLTALGLSQVSKRPHVSKCSVEAGESRAEHGVGRLRLGRGRKTVVGSDGETRARNVANRRVAVVNTSRIQAKHDDAAERAETLLLEI